MNKQIYDYFKKSINVVYFFIIVYYAVTNQWNIFNLEIYFTTFIIIRFFVINSSLNKISTINKEKINGSLLLINITYSVILILSNFNYFESIDGLLFLGVYLILKSTL